MTVIIDCAAISCETSSSFCFERIFRSKSEEEVCESEEVAVNN